MNKDSARNSRVNGHYNCLLCGEHNRWGLGLKFKLLEDGRVHTNFTAKRVLQGYEGILHGGVMCALMDAAMVHCLFHNGHKAVTADMNTRFIKPVPIGSELDLYGELLKNKKSLYYMKSVLCIKGDIMALAEAKFMRYSPLNN